MILYVVYISVPYENDMGHNYFLSEEKAKEYKKTVVTSKYYTVELEEIRTED